MNASHFGMSCCAVLLNMSLHNHTDIPAIKSVAKVAIIFRTAKKIRGNFVIKP